MNKDSKKFTFNKGSVLVVAAGVVWFPIWTIMMNSYPPDTVTIAWFAILGLELILTAYMRKDKRKAETDGKIRAMDAITKYVNEDNVEAVIKHFTGIDLSSSKNKDADDISATEDAEETSDTKEDTNGEG